MHSMHSMLNIEGGGGPAASSYRQNIQTYSPEYAFYAFYAKYGGGGGPG